METWTQADERKLEEMRARKDRVNGLRRAPVVALVRIMPTVYIADWMISRADDIRDALEPFDSGVREHKS